LDDYVDERNYQELDNHNISSIKNNKSGEFTNDIESDDEIEDHQDHHYNFKYMECDNNAKKENNNCENTPSNHQKEKEDTFCNDKDVT